MDSKYGQSAPGFSRITMNLDGQYGMNHQGKYGNLHPVIACQILQGGPPLAPGGSVVVPDDKVKNVLAKCSAQESFGAGPGAVQSAPGPSAVAMELERPHLGREASNVGVSKRKVDFVDADDDPECDDDDSDEDEESDAAFDAAFHDLCAGVKDLVSLVKAQSSFLESLKR